MNPESIIRIKAQKKTRNKKMFGPLMWPMSMHPLLSRISKQTEKHRHHNENYMKNSLTIEFITSAVRQFFYSSSVFTQTGKTCSTAAFQASSIWNFYPSVVNGYEKHNHSKPVELFCCSVYWLRPTGFLICFGTKNILDTMFWYPTKHNCHQENTSRIFPYRFFSFFKTCFIHLNKKHIVSF